MENMEGGARVRGLVDNAMSLGESFDNLEALNIRMLCRSSLELFRQACIYLEENDMEHALMLFARFATLGLKYLPKHSQYSNSLPETGKIKEKLPLALKYAEQLKGKLKEVYNVQHEQYLKNVEDERKRNEQRIIVENNKSDNHVVNDDVYIPPMVNTHQIQYPQPQPSPFTSPESFAPSAPPQTPQTPQTPAIAYSTGVPTFDRTVKPQTNFNYQTRRVVVPMKVMEKFAQLAAANTSKNTETMGILSGKVVKNEFVITHVIVPKQSGGPNSCTSQNEDDIYSYQDRNDLMSVGWIHTHPTQTAFLSSVDLHTHLSYQLLRPESIAIVCAPEKDEVGIFSLTENGMEVLKKCSQSGFHQHDETNQLFFRPGHVRVEEVECTIVDLREINSFSY